VATGIKSNRTGIKGALDRFLASRVETLLSIPGSKLHRKFTRATKDVKATQLSVLDEILRYAADTVFAREHGFDAICNHRDFAKNVPVADYEDLRPYIDRHTKGEENVLFPGKPIMYNRSSGTTALPKLIPITPYNLERTIKDRGKLWLYGLVRDFPGIYKGKDLTLVSPAVEGHVADGTPFGSLSGLVYESIPGFMKLVHSAPECAMIIEDYNAKIYSLLRFALPSDITSIFTGNPSTVHNLVTKADLFKESLIRDIRDGTLKKDLDIDPRIRAEMEDRLSPDPDRGAALDKLAGASDALRPADYWPNLRLVHTWKNGNCRLVIPKLIPWFKPGTPILDFGYLASEITATDLIVPETDGSILSVLNGFYEFRLCDKGNRGEGDFLMAHELEVQKRYFVYVTTFSGLYRYDMNDVLEVVGHFNGAPILRFLFKGKGITSIQGEKFSEEQFIESVKTAADATGIRHDFFVGFADADKQRYELYIEFLDAYRGVELDRFAQVVDEAMCRLNLEYDAKRKSERLKPLTVVTVGANFFQRYRALRLAEGAHDGQIKWLNLSSTDATKKRMQHLLKQG
jgi:hypothetical protein